LACGNDPAPPTSGGKAVETKPSQSSATVAESKASAKTTGFDGPRAFAHVKKQVEFGPRPAGSAALEKTREYLVNELKSYGLKTVVEEFTPKTPKGKLKMKNIIAELPGESSDVIILSSHYDTKLFKEFTFVGANDGGSSTGALLEIARVMAGDQTKRRFTYQFVFFDGEEAFCAEWSECLDGRDNTYGSRQMVERLQKEKRLMTIKALILLDMVGDKDLEIPREENSSGWLVDAIWSTARELGFTREFSNHTQAITDDHINFLQVGIPSVDLIDFDYGNDETSFWHTKEDTLDKISPQSLKIVGDVLLLSLPKIEAQIR
jgi:Zn-dependent M28 family amino/carboxypeptidase